MAFEEQQQFLQLFPFKIQLSHDVIVLMFMKKHDLEITLLNLKTAFD